MGKSSEQKHHGGIPTDKSSPNRKWAKILNNINVLDHHRWRYVKKILPHKKHAEGYEAIPTSEDGANNAGDKTYVCDGDVCTIRSSRPEENTTKEPGLAKKGRAARIKAKFSKEALKKRVRHKRNLTCPTTSTGATENGSSSVVQPVSESAAALEGTVHIEQPPTVKDTTNEKNDVPCTTHMDRDHPVDGENLMDKGTDVGDKNSKDDSDSWDEDQQPFPVKLKNIQHLGRSATFHQPKELLDAMDVLSMNKDFFLKVLEDPELSLAQHFMVQHASGKRKHLGKSGTFPRPCLSKEKELCSSSLGVKPNRNISIKENNGKPFKDSRQKIKHVIKESKEERRRIAMDSVLHKVPYGHQYPETKKEGVEHLSLKMDDDKDSPRIRRKDKKPVVNRWPSLNESIERYRQLLETSFDRATKHTSSNALKLRGKGENASLPQEQRAWGRMSSSPDLSLRLQSHLGESSSMSPNNIPFPRAISLIKTSMSFNVINSHLLLSSLKKSGTEEKEEEVVGRGDLEEEEETDVEDQEGILFGDLEGDGNHGEHNVTQSPAMGLEDSNSQEDSDDSEESIALSGDSRMSQQQDLFSLDGSTVDPERPEAETLDHPPNFSHQVRVRPKDQGHFDYVKDILQLSGYSENQALGAWQSTNQPVDPSLFKELESCSLQEPYCLESEEETRCNRLLLFDSINEVLISTYEKSMTYWNVPLTTSSRIHPMPKGYRVLEEVWGHISWYLNSSVNQLESSLDHVIMHDLNEDDGWMNLQFEAEGTVLELEDLIFDELLMEAMPS